MGVKHDWLDKRKRSKQWPCPSFPNAKSPQIFLGSSLLLPVSFCMYSGFSRDNSGQSFTNLSPDSWLNLIGSHRVLMQPKTLQHFPFFFSIKRKGFNFNKVKNIYLIYNKNNFHLRITITTSSPFSIWQIQRKHSVIYPILVSPKLCT